MTNIILCGGSGSRLWPISRTLLPKQFVKLFNGQSLFQKTVNRNSVVCSRTFVVSNEKHYFLALDQLAETGNCKKIQFLLEPVGRNTAPAIALACMALNADEMVLVSPSDHLVANEDAYIGSLLSAKKAAQENNLVTFGIEPKYPETGYGYIESSTGNVQVNSICDVINFHEKPDQHRAKSYFESGNFYWNSGIFCFKAGVFLSELEKYSPEIYENSRTAFENSEAENNAVDPQKIRIKKELMMKIPSKSIDHAVMEKSSIVKMISVDYGWNDLGTFRSLHDETAKDEQGNSILFSGNSEQSRPVTVNSSDNLIIGNDKQIALIDVKGLVIVNTDDALLISRKESSRKVKDVVNELNLSKDTGHLIHTHKTVLKPWGTFTLLDAGQGYKIKRITVLPGKRFSLQKHLYRNEHWVVVKGQAIVTAGESEIKLQRNDSVYIEKNKLHRIENPGKSDLIFVEVQIGHYTEEDDIIRVEDDFGRDSLF